MSGACLFTIGVYGTSEESFFSALRENRVTHFVDVRRRRGLRGRAYSYANAVALKSKLDDLGMTYIHELSLAPSEEVRKIQKVADAKQSMDKRARVELSPEFVLQFETESLRKFDVDTFLAQFPVDARIVLFCVEAMATACHRSLVAERLARATGSAWRDITPGELN